MKLFGVQRIHCFVAVWASLHASVVQECSGFLQQHQRQPAMRSFLGGATPFGFVQPLQASNRGGMEDTFHQKEKTLYDILGAPPNATKQELKLHYVKLAKLSHPDALISNGGAAAAIMPIDFAEVVSAWKVLADPKTRQRYDRELKAKKFTDMAQRFANDRLEEAIPAMAAMMDRLLKDPYVPNPLWDDAHQHHHQQQCQRVVVEPTQTNEIGWFGSVATKIGGETEHFIQSMANKVVDVLGGFRDQALYADYERAEPMMKRSSVAAEVSSTGTMAFSSREKSFNFNGLMTSLISDSALVLSNLVDVVATNVKGVFHPRVEDTNNL